MSRLSQLHHHAYSKTVFGFWLYLMSDAMMFGVIFATYAVLQNGTAGLPSVRDSVSLSFILVQTLVLLTSSFACGPALLAAHRQDKNRVFFWVGQLFLLGAIFLGMQVSEFSHLVSQGYVWHKSAFLSAYFNLIGTHTIHIIVGLLWIGFLMIQILRFGLTPVAIKRLTCLRMFWQFVNIVWIFIFTFVYLMGEK